MTETVSGRSKGRGKAKGVTVERVPMSDAIKADPDYSDPVPDIRYDGRFNLRVARTGTGKVEKPALRREAERRLAATKE